MAQFAAYGQPSATAGTQRLLLDPGPTAGTAPAVRQSPATHPALPASGVFYVRLPSQAFSSKAVIEPGQDCSLSRSASICRARHRRRLTALPLVSSITAIA